MPCRSFNISLFESRTKMMYSCSIYGESGITVRGGIATGRGDPGNSARYRLNGVFFKCELVLLSTCNDRCPVAFTARHFVVWSRVIVHCFGSAGFIGAGVSHTEPDTIPVVIVAPLLRVTNELFLWGFTRICRIGNRFFPCFYMLAWCFVEHDRHRLHIRRTLNSRKRIRRHLPIPPLTRTAHNDLKDYGIIDTIDNTDQMNRGNGVRVETQPPRPPLENTNWNSITRQPSFTNPNAANRPSSSSFPNS